MTKFQSFFAHVAAVAGHLAPVLVALEQAPGSVGRYAALIVSALVSFGLIKLDLTKAAPNAAGFVKRELVLFLAALGVFAGVGCAVLRSAEKDPSAAFASLEADMAKTKAGADAFCKNDAAKLSAAVPELAPRVSKFCADLTKVESVHVTVSVAGAPAQ
jgi:hypothetical protein